MLPLCEPDAARGVGVSGLLTRCDSSEFVAECAACHARTECPGVDVDGDAESSRVRHGRDPEADVALDRGDRQCVFQRCPADQYRPVGSVDVGDEQGDEPLASRKPGEETRTPSGTGELVGPLGTSLRLR